MKSVVHILKKILAISLFCLVHIQLHGQSDPNCSIERLEVYLNDSDTTGTNIRTTPSGNVKQVIKNDPKNEQYFSFKVCQMKGNWLLIRTNYPEQVTGWIHNSVVSTNLRAYSSPILIYKTANNQTAHIDSVNNEQQVQILESVGLYSRIAYTDSKGEKAKGYVLNDDLCGNPYTNCN